MEAQQPTEHEEQEISQHELTHEGYEIEEDQKTPQEVHSEGHPTPDRPSGRTP